MEKSGVGFWEGYGAHLAGANRALAGGPLSAQSEVAAEALRFHGYLPTQLSDDDDDGDDDRGMRTYCQVKGLTLYK